MLELAECGNFAPELAEFFRTVINAVQDLDDDDTEYDKQRCCSKEGPDQLGMDLERRPRHKPGQPILYVHAKHTV